MNRVSNLSSLQVLLLITVCLLTGHLGGTRALAADPPLGLGPLMRVPNLGPFLTKAEVEKTFIPWTARVAKIRLSSEWPADLFLSSRAALAPSVPKVSAVTLYSLFPVDAPNLKNTDPDRADKLMPLPRFHHYPIFGTVKIVEASEANRWADFLRDQIYPGASVPCHFRPRHGFRFSTEKGDMDMLMCFSCDQLAVMSGAIFDRKHNPVFSPAVKEVVNALFDKRSVQRDRPGPGE